jgi:Arc/MetJ-type ribon-helix-helix transcriptional regulator
MSNIEISLDDEEAAFVEAQIAAGGYASASEYLCALIREAQKRQSAGGSADSLNSSSEIRDEKPSPGDRRYQRSDPGR